MGKVAGSSPAIRFSRRSKKYIFFSKKGGDHASSANQSLGVKGRFFAPLMCPPESPRLLNLFYGRFCLCSLLSFLINISSVFLYTKGYVGTSEERGACGAYYNSGRGGGGRG